ncbi:hypothetical protein [Mucilaginibacter jinjuensis]|uniref:Endosialidase-like protein n=1 Tax=Mucilaginibacter jinjuensis TaxID=1176721 RepID=A0ABY7TEP7_9SPHI|nr:hypothetical protein [Mucilaginibacter jinjuensis]WCT13642.1 hypothetical protein PQO05_06800 [Mucilaginibacter jinjuensis]
MKKLLILILPVLAINYSYAQITTDPNTGNVGIGTTSPASKLTVDAGGATGGGVLIKGTSGPGLLLDAGSFSFQAGLATSPYYYSDIAQQGDAVLRIGQSSNTGSLIFGIRNSTGDFKFTTFNGSTTDNVQMIIKQNGNIGVGTSIPNYKLDVAGTGNINGQAWFSYGNNNMSGYSWTNAALTTNSIEIVNNNATVSNLSPTLVFHRYGSGGPQFRLAADGSNVLYLESAGANSSRSPLAYGGGPNSYFSRLHVDANLTTSGNIGVGVAVPMAKLHISDSGTSSNSTGVYNGNMVIQGNSGGRNSTSGATLEFVIPANTDGSNPWGQGRIITVAGNADNGNATGKMIIGTRRAFDKKTGTGYTWNYGDDLVIDGTGQIGVGTLNPDAKLAVQGTIHATEVLVDPNVPTPDYVFDKEYNLASLKDVKNYIDQNHHLPEIPSAAQVAKEGINLGEMNAKLLKKIEELTLYLIENEKQLKEQKRLIQANAEKASMKFKEQQKLINQLKGQLTNSSHN